MHADIEVHPFLKEHIRLIVCDSLIVKFTVALVLGDLPVDPQSPLLEVDVLDLQAGHIPGAVNLPARALQREGRFLPVEEIRGKLAEIGVTSGDQVAVYSGSGLHASLFVQAMHEAGLPGASLFIGGWSKWAGDPARPIVRL